jgi:siroheme synthase-like protein
MEHPRQLPVMLSPSLGPALVVGGGAVALRKTRSLVEAGFQVHVVAPAMDPGFQGLAGVRQTLAGFKPAHLAGAALVFACTHDRSINGDIGRRARAAGLPVLVADAGDEGTFSSPAVARHDGVTLAVSTGGADPGRARAIRDRLARALEQAAGDCPARRGADGRE